MVYFFMVICFKYKNHKDILELVYGKNQIK